MFGIPSTIFDNGVNLFIIKIMVKTKNKWAVKLGAMGGKVTLEKYGTDHFRNAGKLGMLKRWSGHIKKTADGDAKIMFRCNHCKSFFETTEKLLANVKVCPKCNLPINDNNI